MTFKRPRLFFWLLATLILFAIVAWLAPQQIGVSLYKVSLVTTAGIAGYWLDRALFPYARPDSYLALPKSCRYDTHHRCDRQADYPVVKGYALVFAAAMIRRAVIVGCAMLAIGLGA